jgi:inosine-uridine nucleoside N-ribohydrolase
MQKKIFFVSLSFFFFTVTYSQKPIRSQSIIFDSDMGPDYDDVGAMALLHAFADSGYINILATMASTKYEGVAAVMNVLNTYFSRPNLPIGIPKQNGLLLRDWQHWTDTLIKKYPHQIKTNDEVPDAVEVYRKVLAAQPDTSVTIVTVGFLTNLANLLQSQPDKYSSLDGKALVRQKVKQLVCMAGKFPEGKEFNVKEDAASSRYVFTNWQTPTLFSGFEIGDKIKVGLPLINNNNIQNSHVKDVFSVSIPMAAEDSAGRKSWDETAVLVAVKGHQSFYRLQYGHIIVAEDGSNIWDTNGTQQAYLKETVSPEIVQSYINKLIQHQPRD